MQIFTYFLREIFLIQFNCHVFLLLVLCWFRLSALLACCLLAPIVVLIWVLRGRYTFIIYRTDWRVACFHEEVIESLYESFLMSQQNYCKSFRKLTWQQHVATSVVVMFVNGWNGMDPCSICYLSLWRVYFNNFLHDLNRMCDCENLVKLYAFVGVRVIRSYDRLLLYGCELASDVVCEWGGVPFQRA